MRLIAQHPVSAPLKPKRVKEAGEDSSSDDDDEPTVDMVSSEDAWLFPIGGSVMLVGLYVLFKYLNKEYLNYLFTAYFGVIGIFAVSNVSFASPPQRTFCCRAVSTVECYEADVRSGLRGIRGLRGGWARRFIGIMLSSNNVEKVPSTLRLESDASCRNWNVQFHGRSYFELLSWSRDVYLLRIHQELVHVQHLWSRRGVQFPGGTIRLVESELIGQYIQLDTFWAGFVLLGGLFFYDIFFVFGTNVMVTVAVSMDVPIKVSPSLNLKTNALVDHGPQGIRLPGNH